MSTATIPFAKPFSPSQGLPYEAWSGAWYVVKPTLRWRTWREVTMSSWVDRQRREFVFETGVELSLVAVHTCDDINGACGYWQGEESAYAFRVESGEHVGLIVEWWGQHGEPPVGVEPTDFRATVNATERVSHLGGLRSASRDEPVATDDRSP